MLFCRHYSCSNLRLCNGVRSCLEKIIIITIIMRTPFHRAGRARVLWTITPHADTCKRRSTAVNGKTALVWVCVCVYETREEKSRNDVRGEAVGFFFSLRVTPFVRSSRNRSRSRRPRTCARARRTVSAIGCHSGGCFEVRTSGYYNASSA